MTKEEREVTAQCWTRRTMREERKKKKDEDEEKDAINDIGRHIPDECFGMRDVPLASISRL